MMIVGCSYPERIRDGRTAYERKQYAVAAKMLEKEFNSSKESKDKGQKAFLIGNSYQRINDNENAIAWYKKAIDNGFGPNATIAYANALKENENYTDAELAFLSAGQLTGDIAEYKEKAAACQTAAEWLADINNSEFSVTHLDFNTEASDYAPYIYKDNSLIFTSDRSASTGKDDYKWTGVNFSDLYTVNLDSKEVLPFSTDINTPFNEGTASFDKNYSTIYFTKCGASGNTGVDYCKIMTSKKNREGNWSKPRIMSFVNGAFNYAHPYFAEDENRLYFSSDRSGGMGKSDLYYVQKTDDGWGEPVSLGRLVNTEQDEKFPIVYKDTLYFASDGHVGMGGLDIFYSPKNRNSFAKPTNLKPPLNTGGDDFGLIIDAEKSTDVTLLGYFSSTRKEGNGKDDIYQFERVRKTPVLPPMPVDTTPIVIVPDPPKPDPKPDPIPDPPKIVYEFKLLGKVFEKIYENPSDPNSTILGNRPLPNASISMRYQGEVVRFTSDENGEFRTTLSEKTRYQFLASKTDYFSKSNSVSTDARDERNPIRTYEVSFVLDRLFKNKEINLEDIYYDFDKWNIRPDAEPPLNNLVQILQENPSIRIQLASHTDCRGEETYNKTLSQKRAQSAVDYLISRGIAPTRLSAKGYGEESPAVQCSCNSCTEEEHQANRRTTFKVVE